MRPPRISIAGSTVAVAIFAVGLAILREDLTNVPFYRHGHTLVVGVLPMACLLVWGLLVGIGGLIRRGECHPFLVGFEVFGWTALFLFVAYDAGTYRIGEKPLDVVAPLARRFFRTDHLAYRDYKVLFFHITVFSTPALVAALIGGALSQALDIRLVSRPLPTAHGRDDDAAKGRADSNSSPRSA